MAAERRAAKLSNPFIPMTRALRAIIGWFGRPKLVVILLVLTLSIVVTAATLLFLAEQALGGESDFHLWRNAFWYMFSSVAGIGVGARAPATETGRTLAIIAGVSGSALKGLFTAAVASAFVNRLILEGKGLGDYELTDHILICGWNVFAKEMLRVLDEQAYGEGVKIVLLADLPENPLPQSRIKFVRGDATLDADLERASAKDARSAILLADESHGPIDSSNADARTVLTSLAVESVNPDIYTVAELRDPANRRHFARTKTDELIASSELAGGLLARSALNPGVGNVFETLLRLDRSAEVYVIPPPMSCIGKTFEHALKFMHRERQVIVMGVKNGHTVELNPPAARMLHAADHLIILSDTRPAVIG